MSANQWEYREPAEATSAVAEARASHVLRPLPDHWTPTIIQAGALFILIFQSVYLLFDMPTASPAAMWLHVANLGLAMFGFVMSLFPFGRIHGRAIALVGLCSLIANMTAIAILTGNNDWFYASIAFLTMGAAAMMPWEISWQTALNGAAFASVLVQSHFVADQSSILHWLIVALSLGISQTATMIGQGYRGQVEDARIDAFAASKAKSEFLSSMSHEIRTPMNAVLGMADLLLETETSLEQRRYLNVMVANGNSLLELINGILDLARIESGRLQIEKSEFDITDLIHNTISTFGVGAHTKGLELIARIAPGVPERLVGDPLRLRQILINLIGNAVKFTEQGEVVLEIGRDSGSKETAGLCFSVSDTGIGIAPDKLNSIFSSFTQADSSTTRQYGGTGLGLAIARRLVDLMDGRIWVESEPGRGSKFSFTVRFGVAARVISPSAQVVPSLAGHRVLIVDDNHINRLIAREMIADCGAEVTEADSGKEALQALRGAMEAQRPYKIVLLDMRMPGMDGLEVAGRIRDEKLPIEPLVLMLSSDDFKPQLTRVKELGLDAYLMKPLTRKGLFEAINRVLNDANRNSADALPIRSAPAVSRDASVPKSTDPAMTKILVADDSPDNRLLIAAYLRREPYYLDFAEDGKVAFEKFVAHRYDMIFMDVQMPQLDGLSATRMIRQWEKSHARNQTPVIALSAAALEEDVRRSLEAGCDLHISKPVKKRVLLETIRNLARLRPIDKSPLPVSAPENELATDPNALS